MSDNNTKQRKFDLEKFKQRMLDSLVRHREENGWKCAPKYNYIMFFGDPNFTIPNANKIKNSYDDPKYGYNLGGAIFYATDHEIIYVTKFVAAIDIGNNANVYTESFTLEDHRGKRLFKNGREMLEDALEQYYKTTGVKSIVFRVTLVNPETQGFLEKYFINRGYEKVDYEGDVGVIDLKKVVKLK